MMRLFRVELSRFVRRRASRVMVGLALLMIGVTGGFIFTSHEQMPTNEQATERAARQRAACEADEREFFRENEGRIGFEDEEEFVQRNCGWIRPQNFFNDRRFCFLEVVANPNEEQGCERADAALQGREIRTWNDDSEEFFGGYEGILPVVSLLLLFVAAILPASFIGAEYRNGTMENLLLWEPRRIRVAGAKLAAGMTWSAVIHASLLVILVTMLYGSAAAVGTTAGADVGYWGLIVNLIVRGAIAAALASAIAMAVAFITRFSAGAIAALIGYGVFIAFTIPVLARGFLHREVVVNTQAFLRIGEVPSWRRVRQPGGWTNDVFELHHGSLAAGMYLFGWAALAVGLALWLFQRRDVD